MTTTILLVRHGQTSSNIDGYYMGWSNEDLDQEGYAQVARMFRAAAEAETVHAHSHLRALGGIKGTKKNLQDAVTGETHEFKKMYPEMIEGAKAEKNSAAERSFSYANTVERTHAELYQKLLNSLGTSKENYPYYVCPVCGHTAEKSAPGTCPVCGTKIFRIGKG